MGPKLTSPDTQKIYSNGTCFLIVRECIDLWQEDVKPSAHCILSCILTSVRGMQVPWPVTGVCRYPDQWQGYAGTLTSVSGMQVPWPVSGVCRYPAGTLTSVRGMQVPCRYPDQCQGYAGTLQVSWPVSGVCRYPAGILTSVRGMQKLVYWVFLIRHFPGRIIRRFSARTRAPHGEGNSMEGHSLFNVGIQYWRDIVKDKGFAWTGNRAGCPRFRAQYTIY